MSTVVFINGNHIKDEGPVVDGGFSRNKALEEWLLNHVDTCIDIRLHRGPWRVFQVYSVLLFSRGKTIFFQYPLPGVPLYYKNCIGKLLSRFFFVCLKKALKQNQVLFDVSDLKYEQALDLELMDTWPGRRGAEIEKMLFSTTADFIFASNNMCKYVCEKYGVDLKKTDVCINGGPALHDNDEVPDIIQADKINYVYTGTLNRGRQIEAMINAFPETDSIHLFLLGPDGEWISTKKRNITILGAVEEHKAHTFASRCDVGLIPYDEKRFYYNIAYPTKLSFYITAGIPFLSTPVKEVARINDEIDGGWLSPIEDWDSMVLKLKKEDIAAKRQHVKQVSDQYLWETIFASNKFIH